jgi:hypothetical protein
LFIANILAASFFPESTNDHDFTWVSHAGHGRSLGSAILRRRQLKYCLFFRASVRNIITLDG